MSSDEDTPPRKFKLRRIGLAKIEEGNQEKSGTTHAACAEKKRAQMAYYDGQSSDVGTSPLLRSFSKKPVKQRLGRRMPFRGTDTSAILPKPRIFRLNGGTSNNIISRRKLRPVSIQQRLYNIRGMPQRSMMPHSTPKKIKLRRLVPNNLAKPQNFKIEVQNNNGLVNRRTFKQRRFKQILNHHIQIEIHNLQKDFQGGTRSPIMNVIPATTGMNMNDRFAILF